MEKAKTDEQIDICTEIINLASRIADSHTRLLIMSRANDLRQALRQQEDSPKLF